MKEEKTMKTYQFTAFRDERYVAYGEVQADSPEEAKAKIIERYHDEGLNFRDYVDGDQPDHFMLIDEEGEEFHLEDETPPDVFKALKALIEKADDLIAAMQPAPAQAGGATGEFEDEVSALTGAANAAAKAMAAEGGIP
jgi:hypothetical protein